MNADQVREAVKAVLDRRAGLTTRILLSRLMDVVSPLLADRIETGDVVLRGDWRRKVHVAFPRPYSAAALCELIESLDANRSTEQRCPTCDHPLSAAAHEPCENCEANGGISPSIAPEAVVNVVPSGCRWCGVEQRTHVGRWAVRVGWHQYEPPEQWQIKQRMIERRKARHAQASACAERTIVTDHAPNPTNEPATPNVLERIEYVYIDSAPHTDAYDADELLPEYANLPEAFLDRLAELLANRDAVSCWQCGAGAGYVLVERGDREVIEWVTTALAREGSNPVAVLCEACSPYLPTEPDPQPTPGVTEVVHTLRRIAADMHAKIAADDDGSSWGGGAQTMVELLEAEAAKIGNGGPMVSAASYVGAAPTENYVSIVLDRLRAELTDLDPTLADLYTLLALVRGRATTVVDVHDAWAVWRNRTRPFHPDLVPFRRLTEDVRERDRPYMEAIHRAAPDRLTGAAGLPADPAERLRLAAAGRRRYARDAPAGQCDVLHEEARVLDWAIRIVTDDPTLEMAIPAWLDRDAGRAVPVDGAAMDARAADRAPCGNPNCAYHGPTQTPDLPERTPEVTE